MSGTGGFYHYNCKYYFIGNPSCPNKVEINNGTCETCLAQGLDDDVVPADLTVKRPMEIGVPQIVDGTLRYTWMEVVETGDPTNYWTLRPKAPRPQVPTGIPEPGTFIPPLPGVPVPFGRQA